MSDQSLHTTLQTIASHAAAGVICCDTNGQPLWWNEFAIRFFFSVTPESMATARRIDDLLCPNDPEQLQAFFAKGSGTLTVTLETIEQPVVVELLLFALDVDGREATPIKLMVIRPMGTAQETWPADIFRLFGTLLHRMKNALAVIKLLAQGARIEMGFIQGAGRAVATLADSYFERMDSEVDQAVDALDTIKHLLVSTGLNTEHTSPASILQSVVDETAPRLDAAGVTVHLDILGTSVSRHLDADAVRQVIYNILERTRRNALATKRPLQLHILLDQRDSALTLRFHDDGPAVPLETTERLERHEFGATHEELPLTVVHWIVSRYHGRISYSSPTEPGCTIEIWFPPSSTAPAGHQEAGGHAPDEDDG